MTFKLANNQPAKMLCRLLLGAPAGLCFLLILSPSTIQAESITVNVVEWTPVITEFQISERDVRYRPPFARVESQHPTIPSAWETLKDMVKIKLRGKRWGEDEPVIGGWADWMDEEGASGIEAMRSDKAPEGSLPVPSLLRGPPVSVRWIVEIWGKNLSRALAETDPSLEGLGPADPEFQEAIKKRIEVRDFSLTVHKLEGEVSLGNIRKGALFDPFKVLGEWDYTRSLAEYESQEFLLHRGAIYIGELQLRMRLFFTEVDEGRADTPVEAYLRFICGSKVDFRVIGHQMRSRRIR